MSKSFLVDTLKKITADNYAWMLYFFKLDRRNENPYAVHKVRFKNDNYLVSYANTLVNMIRKYQMEKCDDIKDYNGENSKVSCDKLELGNELIKTQWNYLWNAVAGATDKKIEGKYHGYILTGQPTDNSNKSLAPITFFRVANPVINLKNKKNAIFKFSEENGLDLLADEVCKLYLDVDFIVVNDTLYAFNYRFEEMFHLEKTMQKIKGNAIEQILKEDAFSDKAHFENLAKAYKSPRTFITLKEDRVNKLARKTTRKRVAALLDIPLDENGRIEIQTEQEAYRLIKYLCFKIFKDAETADLLEASNISKVPLGT